MATHLVRQVLGVQNYKSNITKYIHVGLPKNLSSTLQEFYFSRHPEIYHLGIGVGSLIDYIDDDVNVLFENYLLYSRDFEYAGKEEYFEDVISAHIENAIKDNKKAIGVSLELLSFTFTPDMIDVTQKTKRLKKLFGSDTEIILVIRNQKDLIESLYREFIKIGYAGSYKEYIDFIYLRQSRSFLHEFKYDNLANLYSDHFGKENLKILVAEDYRQSNGDLIRVGSNAKLIDDISNILGVSNKELEIGHSNPPLSNRDLFQKRALNSKNNHDLSNDIFEGADVHRLYKYFEYELNYERLDPFRDVKTKRNSIDMARELSKSDSREIDYAADPEILKQLSNIFIQSNERLSRDYDVELPDSYYEMEM